MFTQNEIDTILEKKLNKDFFDITLKQQKKDNPIIYRGPGTIYHKNDGEIYLKLYHTNKKTSIKLLSNLFNNSDIKPGKLIPEHYYYTLRIRDGRKTWTSKNIFIDNDLELSENGCLIITKIKNISVTENRIKNKDTQNHFITYIQGKYDLPANEIKTTENYSKVCITSLDINNVQYKIEQEEKHIEVYATIPRLTNTINHIKIFLEALSISIGKHLHPLLLLTVEPKSSTAIIYSNEQKNSSKKLWSPLPQQKLYEAKNLNTLIQQYINTINDPLSHIYVYWYRVYSDSTSHIENQALTLTTCIEGILKEYFYELGLPEQNYIKLLTDAIIKLESNDIGIHNRALKRIIDSIKMGTHFTIKEALIKFETTHILTKYHLKIWNKIRNKSHHADILNNKPEDLEKYYTQLNTCLEILYIIIFCHIKYKGEYIQYSQDGWPTAYFDYEKEHQSPL